MSLWHVTLRLHDDNNTWRREKGEAKKRETYWERPIAPILDLTTPTLC